MNFSLVHIQIFRNTKENYLYLLSEYSDTLIVCFHCPTPIPTPTPIPIPMKLGSIKMCRTVSTEPRLIPILIPIPIPMATVPILAPIKVPLRRNLFIKRVGIIIQASGGNY